MKADGNRICILRTLLIASVLIAAAIYASFLLAGTMNYTFGWWDQTVAKPVSSPNGVYRAFIGSRSLFGRTRSRLYVRKGSGPARVVMDVDGTDPQWSPDSKMVVVTGSGKSTNLYVYRPVTNHSGKISIGPTRWKRRGRPIAADWTNVDDKAICEFRGLGGMAYERTEVSVSDSARQLHLRVSDRGVAAVNFVLPP